MDEVDAREAGPAEARRQSFRPLLLAALGLATGIAAHLILGSGHATPTALQASLLMGVTLGTTLTAFTLERRLWWASLLFSVLAALAAAFVIWWNGSPGGWSATEGWRTVSLLLAVAIAAPLFQAARDEGALRTPYASVHDHAWTNAVLWCACWVFVAIVWLLAWLLASLFDLIKIALLRELLQKEWFHRPLLGLAFGAAIGLLREHDAVVRLLQRVVAMVLAVLAPVLAIGLAIFLLALPFTGLQVLWNATLPSTPTLLACVIGALILVNAVIGSRTEEERRAAPLRYGAMLLAATMLPLAVLAAIATGLRVGQYGYTPERLWALVFVGIAVVYGAAYLGALALGRLEWTAKLRPVNLVLGLLLCALGLVLATPLINFNRISTDDQVARLESGRTTIAKFDWQALAFDFGEPGRDALRKLASSRNAVVREKAIEVARIENRFEVPDGSSAARAETLDRRLRVFPAGKALPDDLRKLVADGYPCGFGDANCTLVFLEGGQDAVLLQDACYAPEPGPTPTPTPGAVRKSVAVQIYSPNVCSAEVAKRYVLEKDKWIDAIDNRPAPPGAQARAAKAAGHSAGQVEIRKVQRRQVFVGGQPVGDAFE